MAQSTPKQSLLVLSKHDHALAIVDPATLKVVARAPVGPDPHEVIASSDGKTAYVSIYGGGAYHVLSVIDLIAQKALPDIDLGALNDPTGSRLWAASSGSLLREPKWLADTTRFRGKLTGSWVQGKTEPT